MNILKALKKFTFLILITTLIVSCSDDDDKPLPGPNLNIIETSQSMSELSIFVEAIEQADLVNSLFAVYGAKTVLVPTNDAFTAYLAEKGFNSLSEVPEETLKQIILYHVIDGAHITAANLMEDEIGIRPSMVTDLDLHFEATASSIIFNDSATVITADIITSNGLMHIVDKVIDLP